MKRVYLLLLLVTAITAIRVPVDNPDKPTKNVDDGKGSETVKKPVYYTTDDSGVDSYLVPPSPYSVDELPADAPATQLVPPKPGTRSEYFMPTETDTQTDWYPIVEALPKPKQINVLPNRPVQQTGIPIMVSNANSGSFGTPQRYRGVKYVNNESNVFLLPSRQLEPPVSGPKNVEPKAPIEQQQLPVLDVYHKFRVIKPSAELELPLLKSEENYKSLSKNVRINFNLAPAEPTLALHLTPPKPLASKYGNPTKLYPKKYAGDAFKPVPIPIGQFTGETVLEVPKARPLKPFKLTLAEGNEYNIPNNENNEHKRRLKGTQEKKKQEELDAAVEQTYSDENVEQEASETNFGHPGRNSYPAPLRQPPPRAPAAAPAPAPSERTEFRMHGMKGPHSYQFGYDTGKGKNRQFRYEERDNDGRVRGHYGYMEKNGKLRVVNYNADPEHGFHAEAPVDKE